MGLDYTAFGYIGPQPDDRIKTVSGVAGTTLPVFSLNPGYGGTYIIGLASANMNRIAGLAYGGDVVCADTSLDDSYKPLGTSNTPLVAGVYIGYFNGGQLFQQSLNASSNLVSAVIGTRIMILVGGVADLVADGTINRGDLLVQSGSTAGRVITNNSAAAGTIIGVARQAAASPGAIIRCYIDTQ